MSPLMMVLVLVVVVALAAGLYWLWVNRSKLTIGAGCCGTFGGVEEDILGAYEEAYGGGGKVPVRKYGDAVVFPVSTEAALELVKSGKKTVEARLGLKSYRELKKGSKVVYVHGEHGVEKTVAGVKEYPDFAALLKGEGVEKVMPGEKSADAALKTIEGYYAKRIAKGVSFDKLQKDVGGVLAIEIK